MWILKDVQKSEDRTAHKFLEKYESKFDKEGYSTLLRILKGEPAEEIISASEEYDPQLIAIGAKGLTDSPIFSLGSVAQKVTRFSKNSVLIYRAPKKK